MTLTAQQREPTQVSGEWYALLAGPLLWTVYFMVGYLLAEFGCRGGWLTGTVAGWPAASVAVAVLTVAALAAGIVLTLRAIRRWRALPPSVGERTRFAAALAALLGGMFTFLILLTGIPALVLEAPCAS